MSLSTIQIIRKQLHQTLDRYFDQLEQQLAAKHSKPTVPSTPTPKPAEPQMPMIATGDNAEAEAQPAEPELAAFFAAISRESR